MSNILKVKKSVNHAYIPTRGSLQAAGFDLYSAYEYKLLPGKNVLVDTGIQIELPEGTYGRVAPRSKLSTQYSISVGAGVVDPDYRGNIYVLLLNHGDRELDIAQGDRIAQLICEKIMFPDIEVVTSMTTTERNDRGCGDLLKNKTDEILNDNKYTKLTASIKDKTSTINKIDEIIHNDNKNTENNKKRSFPFDVNDDVAEKKIKK